MRQGYRRGSAEWDVAHYLWIRYYPATDGRIREQLCVLPSWQASLAQRSLAAKSWHSRALYKTHYIWSQRARNIAHAHTAKCKQRQQRSHLTVALHDDELWTDTSRPSHFRMDGSSWRVWTVRRKKEKVVLSARPAELWDSEFERATFHSLLGFRGMQSTLRSGG